MKRCARGLQYLLVVLLLSVLLTQAATLVPASAKGEVSGYQTGFQLWRGSDGAFAGWTLSGVKGGTALALDPVSAAPGTDPYAAGAYYGGNYYNGGSFLVGEATGPVVSAPFAFTEAIASWNAVTPEGTWIEVLVSARLGDRWTKWYSLGIWTSNNDDIVTRHSVRLQGDADGYVATDTLVLAKGKVAANALQLKARLFQAPGSSAVPQITSLSLAYSQSAPKKVSQPSTGGSDVRGTVLNVPTCSQMAYPDGGNVWCSPTSTSMVLGFWGYMPGDCEPRVRDAVAGVYDWIYDGHGNWPFNTAYAASRDIPLEGYVARYTSLDALEPWIKAGVPVVMSIAWKKSELTDAPVTGSDGHLIVLVGFDSAGNAVVNDPAASSDAGVRRTYLRSELESVWLTNSGGTVYLIFPVGWNTPGL